MEVTVFWGALWHCTVIHLHLSSHIISNYCLYEVREPALGETLAWSLTCEEGTRCRLQTARNTKAGYGKCSSISQKRCCRVLYYGKHYSLETKSGKFLFLFIPSEAKLCWILSINQENVAFLNTLALCVCKWIGSQAALRSLALKPASPPTVPQLRAPSGWSPELVDADCTQRGVRGDETRKNPLWGRREGRAGRAGPFLCEQTLPADILLFARFHSAVYKEDLRALRCLIDCFFAVN